MGCIDFSDVNINQAFFSESGAFEGLSSEELCHSRLFRDEDHHRAHEEVQGARGL